MTGRLGITLLFLAILLQLAAPAQAAEEKIHLFQSRLEVLPEGGILVTETIILEALGQEIKRGILRDIPIIYRDRLENELEVRLDVLSVARDGHPEPYALESAGNNLRIRIGKGDVFLTPGRHRYEIAYYMERMIGFFDDYDEIYWNVTGNDWSFAIDRAEARVVLPRGAALIQQSAYSGRRGETGMQAIFDKQGAELVWTTTRRLGPGEGLTVAAAFPKGFVSEPDALDELGYMLGANQALMTAFVGYLLVCGYFLLAWWQFGRDPKGGAIFPRFHPPEGISPAAARFVWRMAYDDRVFSAALVSAAVKGRISLSEENGDFEIQSDQSEAASLAPGEKKMVARLLKGRNSIALERRNHRIIRKARDALKTYLQGEYESRLFVTNRRWFLGGLGLIVLVLVTVAITSREPAVVAFMSVWLSIWTCGCYALVVQAWRGLTGGKVGQGLLLSAFALPFLGGEAMGLFMLAQGTGYLAAGVIVLIGVTTTAFYGWLHKPTRAGRAILDQIEGFRLYLEVAERPRLERLHPPEDTPELFERYLPYALALEVENAWCSRFSGLLARAAKDADGQGRLRWYRGSSFRHDGLTGLGRTLGSSLASASGQAATSPKSSSGSGGGGSSGGGGGGGGGSGW